VQQTISQNVGQMMMASLSFFSGMPEALVAKAGQEEVLVKGDEAEDEDEEGVEVEETPVEVDGAEDIFDLDEKLVEPLKHLDSGAEEEEEEEDDVSDTWTEEIYYETPLDQVDTYVQFLKVMTELESQNPQLIQAATSSLSAKQQTQLNEIVQRARSGGEAVEEKKG